MFAKAKKIYGEYPRAFWLYNAIGFIDSFGGYMLYPFFALFLTRKFGIGLSTVALVFAVFSISGFLGGILGGALTDRLGRKGVIIFSLVLSSLSTLGMWFAPTFEIFIIVSAFVGTLANIGGPARGAVIADLLPENKRGEGYGIVRVVSNLAVIGAPAVGGLVAARSYAPLFIADAVISVFSAVIVFFALPETKPQSKLDAKPETVKQTFTGYGRVFMDIPFMGFLLVSMLLILVIMNFNTTLGVFLRDQHGIPEAGYAQYERVDGCGHAVLVITQTEQIQADADGCCRGIVIWHRLWHVRCDFHLSNVHRRNVYHHNCRNDRGPLVPIPGCQFCPRGDARALYGCLRSLLAGCVWRWTLSCGTLSR
jgi:hypothetical protein